MFSTAHSTVTAAWVMATIMMMMMVMEVAAMPKAGGQSKHPGRTHKKTDGATVETVPLQLDSSFLIPSKSIRPLQNSSISPWMYNVSQDDSLFPPLSEAHCLLHGCLDSEGLEDLSLESKPIMHQVLMLRRVRAQEAGHSYLYKLESRLIAVGCTCVRPIVKHQQ